MVFMRLGRKFKFRFSVNKSTIKLIVNHALGYHLFLVVSKNPSVKTFGMSNLCEDGQLVFFGDWDNVFLYRVRDELKRLQRKEDLGTAVILTTGESVDEQGKEYGNYHAVGIGKFQYHKLFDLLQGISVDRNFIRVSDYFNGRYNVLRIYPKTESGEMIRDRPYLKEVLYAPTKRDTSSAFIRFLQLYYGFPDLPDRFIGKPDNLYGLKLVSYQTTQRGWLPFSKLLKSSKSNNNAKTVATMKGVKM